MYEVKTDVEKNRFYICLDNQLNAFTEADMDDFIKEVTEQTKQLQSGFCCITDLRKYEVVDVNEERYIKRVQEILIKAGMKNVIRIINRFGYSGHFQFEISASEMGYRANVAHSLKDAMVLLEQMETGSATVH